MQVIKGMLLPGALMIATTALAQKAPAKTPLPILDASVMYSTERVKTTGNDYAWLQGASGELAFPLYKNFGAAFNVTGERNGNLGTGKGSFSKISFVAGPRYTVLLRRMRFYGEALLGTAHGFDATFPAIHGASSSANAFAMQAGGGLDIDWKRHIAIRAIEASYVRTQFPNGASNVQHDLKLAAGIVFRIPVY